MFYVRLYVFCREANMWWCGYGQEDLHLGDFNGDGNTDMLCHDPINGDKWVALATTDGQFPWTTW